MNNMVFKTILVVLSVSLIVGCNSEKSKTILKNFNGIPAEGKVVFTWNNIKVDEEYTIYVSKESGLIPENYSVFDSGQMINNVTSPHTVSNLKNGVTYYAKLTVTDNKKITKTSSEIKVVPIKDKHYPPTTPWHLADIWWQATNEIDDFTELTIDFKINGELSDNTLLYIAPMGLGELNGVLFYGGIQTKTGGWKTKESRTKVNLGKGAIFSRWSKDEKPISLDYAQGDINTHYESGGYEGEFVSVRSKFNWDEGKYKYIVRKLNSMTENENIFTWFGAYIYNYKNNKEHYIGSLKFKGSKFKYGKNHAAFIEVYGGALKSEIPQITIIFDTPKINGKLHEVKSITINYPDNGDQSTDLPRFADSKVTKDKVKIITIPAGLNDGKTSEVH